MSMNVSSNYNPASVGGQYFRNGNDKKQFAYTGLSCKTTNCKLCSKVLQGVLRCYD